MDRNLQALANKEFDLVVVGGGIFGLFAAWDAAQRGCAVALIERDDFAHATSAHHFRMVHGGIRYLQHGDLPRVRESNSERRTMLRIAPHLVYPLPVVVPAYGHALQGTELLGAGLLVYDLLTLDRNRGICDPGRRIPPGQVLGLREALARFPELERADLTGAAIFYDGQIYNPTRLALAVLQSAVLAGAEAANYVEAVRFLMSGERVIGVQAKDALGGAVFEIRGRAVLNAAGPWAAQLLAHRPELRLEPAPTFSRDACFIVRKPLVEQYALSIQGLTKDPDAVFRRGNRHLFVVPWRGQTLVGVWHKVYDGDPDGFQVTEEELSGYVGEVNRAMPALGLSLKDVSRWMAGLVLFGERQKSQVHLSYGKRSRLIDHKQAHGIEGLVTLIGVRFTTARGAAEKAVDLVCKKLGQGLRRSRTAETTVEGGDFEHFEELVREAVRRQPTGLEEETARRLAHCYGSAYTHVYGLIAQHMVPPDAWAGRGSVQRAGGLFLGASQISRAEALIAVRQEMAVKLGDVVFRRTDLGTAGHPGEAALVETAELVGAELGWDPRRVQMELEEVRQALEWFGARETQPAGSEAPAAGRPGLAGRVEAQALREVGK